MRNLGSRSAVAVTLFCLAAGCAAEREGDRDGPAVADDAPKTEAAAEPERAWRDTFDLGACTLLTSGRNRYFILEPGCRIVLAEGDGEEKEEVFIAVLDETEVVDGV